MNDVTKCTALACISLWGLIQQAHPLAAMGASFGCVFVLLMRDPLVKSFFERAFRKLLLIVLSWGIGYAYGLALSDSKEWAAYTMLGALASAALGSGVFGAANLMFRNDGPLPPWLIGILDRIPLLRKGNDGSQ